MKNSLCNSLTVLLAFALFNGCATQKPAPVVQQAPVIIQKERVISKPFDGVWQTAIEWFATHNTPIKNLDKTSGLISTEYSIPLGQAYLYMSCGNGSSNFYGKTEMANHSGNFNVIIKKLADNSTKINVNVFYGCTINKFKYKSLISTEYVLESSTRTNCSSTGYLEKQILDYLEAGNP